MRTESLRAARSPRAWNRKNLPTQVESYGEGPAESMAQAIRQWPATTARFVRQHPTIVVSCLLTLGVLAWALGLRRAD